MSIAIGDFGTLTSDGDGHDCTMVFDINFAMKRIFAHLSQRFVAVLFAKEVAMVIILRWYVSKS
jgi:hypothetical protein